MRELTKNAHDAAPVLPEALGSRMRFRMMSLKTLALILCVSSLTAVLAAQNSQQDWPVFGNSLSGDNASSAPTGIDAANLASLTRRQVTLDGIVDSAPIYLHGVTVKGATHDVFFVTTSYGKTIAVDAQAANVLWEYTPAGYASWQGTTQLTNATPVADASRDYIFAATPGGTVDKIAVSDGHLVWSTPVTLAPASEKLASPLKLSRGHVVVVTAGYIGDRPPYQGHVALVDAGSGKLGNVWNTLCSNRSGLLDPRSCDGQQSAIWGRSGPAIDPATGNIFVATGNGNYDGKTNWADALIEINPDATQMLANFTPENNADLNAHDLDVGSTSPILMGDGNVAQGSKDVLIRLVSTKDIAGTVAHVGHEIQTVSAPDNPHTAPHLAKWTHNGRTWLYVADQALRGNGGGVIAWTYEGGKLVPAWKNDTPGITPIVAGGLLYVYEPKTGKLHVYNPETGAVAGELAGGVGHWNSPTIIDGHIALGEGNANSHATTGVLDIWSLPVSSK